MKTKQGSRRDWNKTSKRFQHDKAAIDHKRLHAIDYCKEIRVCIFCTYFSLHVHILVDISCVDKKRVKASTEWETAIKLLVGLVISFLLWFSNQTRSYPASCSPLLLNLSVSARPCHPLASLCSPWHTIFHLQLFFPKNNKIKSKNFLSFSIIT